MPTNTNGSVIYEGPSRIDGAPIVVIVTGLTTSSDNTKTDDMVQSWILRSDVSPLEALRTRADASICGGCPHRPQSVGFKRVKGITVQTWFKRSCYVDVSKAPTSVWKAYKRGSYRRSAGSAWKLWGSGSGSPVRMASLYRNGLRMDRVHAPMEKRTAPRCGDPVPSLSGQRSRSRKGQELGPWVLSGSSHRRGAAPTRGRLSSVQGTWSRGKLCHLPEV